MRVLSGPLFVIFCISLLPRLFSAIFNPGFMSFDDYQSMLRLLIPGQSIPSIDWIAHASELRSPLPRILLAPFSWGAASLGILDPLKQIQIIYGFLALVSSFVPVLAFLFFDRLGRRQEAWVAGVLCSLHFLLPYLNTRVMFENFGLITLSLSAYYCFKFKKQDEENFSAKGALFLSLFWLCIGSMMRPQIGICILAITYFVFKSHSKRKNLIWFCVFAALLFFLSGIFDFFLRGEFHQSLKMYFSYNLRHSSDYGSAPFYFYIPIVLALGFFPFALAKQRSFSWKNALRDLTVPLAFVLVFFVSHSLVSHKEERFIFPLIPLLIVLITPWAKELHSRSKLRSGLFLGFNSAAIFLISIVPAQWNEIGVIRFLRSHPHITEVFRWKDSALLYPTIYSEKELPVPGEFSNETNLNSCAQVLLVRTDYLTFLAESNLAILKSFEPGPIEKIVVALNPSKNIRRNGIQLLTPRTCLNSK